MSDPVRWNHNLHYHPLVLAAVPAGARTALDVGCGEGTLARQLRSVVPDVTGIDLDETSLALAREAGGGPVYVRGDVLTHPLPDEGFDVVTSVATLHHLDARTGLRRLAGLVRPGGRLVVVGVARSEGLADLPFEVAAVVAAPLARRVRGYWEHPSPKVWPPPESFASMRRVVRDELPGARWRRHLYWRWSLVWTRPDDQVSDA